MQAQGSAIASKVLCVDDDSYLTDLLRYALTREGFAVQAASNGAEAIRAAQIDPPDIAVVDVNLPDINGFELCAQLRSTFRIPVLMLSARQAEEDVITGLVSGADDYVAKPFSMRVLVYRLHAVLRRLQTPQLATVATKRTYRIGAGSFSPEYNQITLGARTIKLTPTESKILHLLVTHEWQVLSVDQIMDQLWSYDSDTSGSVIKTHVSNLRTKISDLMGNDQMIFTVPGIGYTFRGGPAVLRAEPTDVVEAIG
ncbi:MAG: DeoR family transcriptional regulator [Chloroflexi bacterium]|nr:DeoR family transcriptional regulator [Chloroflexota bacterium]MDB5077261.1 DeoR family transcriptional regulator [Chloroflexota bacterium]